MVNRTLLSLLSLPLSDSALSQSSSRGIGAPDKVACAAQTSKPLAFAVEGPCLCTCEAPDAAQLPEGPERSQQACGGGPAELRGFGVAEGKARHCVRKGMLVLVLLFPLEELWEDADTSLCLYVSQDVWKPLLGQRPLVMERFSVFRLPVSCRARTPWAEFHGGPFFEDPVNPFCNLLDGAGPGLVHVRASISSCQAPCASHVAKVSMVAS